MADLLRRTQYLSSVPHVTEQGGYMCNGRKCEEMRGFGRVLRGLHGLLMFLVTSY